MHGDTDEEATGVCVPERETSPWSWVWNEKARKISVPGHLIRAVNPRIVSTNGRIAVSDSRKINSASTTWELDDGLLGALGAEIWQVISSQGIALDSLPSVDKSPDFPYLFDGDKMGLVCEEGTQQHQENLRL
ncbi:hypothetical protein PLICRDRAFT_35604 [Plicaturopsis crispa FD-325 SS-3]|nr:hypothetical protein PLICRDRAFT_35604 [Plicaturopsis crispa FD-325 SS-3]